MTSPRFPADRSTAVAAPRRRGTPTGRRWTRLMPVIIMVYVIAYIDRVNISFGFPYLNNGLRLNAAQQGFAAGIFFIGYLVLQIPGGYLAERWSVRKWVGGLIIVWGLAAMATGLVRSYGELLAVRFALGVLEGGVQPALMVLIKRWFPPAERGRAYALFILHNPLSSIIMAPFAGLILAVAGWRELFVIQGGVPLVIGAVVWFWLVYDHPEQCRWLSVREREEIATQQAIQDPGPPPKSSPRLALRSRGVWILVVDYLLIQLGMYGLQLWLPTLLKHIFTGALTIGLVAALPSIVAAVVIWYNGRAADRDRRYLTRVAVPLVIGGVVLIASTQVGAGLPWLVVAALCVANACQLCYFGPFWALCSRIVPAAATGVGFALINALGNVGGLLGPYAGGWLQDVTGGSLVASEGLFAVAVIIAAPLTMTLARPLRRALAKAPSEGR